MSKIDQVVQAEIDNGNCKNIVDFANQINENDQNITNWRKRGISRRGAEKISRKFGYTLKSLLSEDTNLVMEPHAPYGIQEGHTPSGFKSMLKSFSEEEIDELLLELLADRLRRDRR